MPRLRALHLALPIAVLSACPSLAPPVLFQQDFEGCKGICGLMTQGTGDAAIVETIHPGEHGLRLSGDIAATIFFDPPISADSVAWVSDGDVAVEIEPDSLDAGGIITLMPNPPPHDENGDPILDPDAGGFRERSAWFGQPIAGRVPVWSLSFRHIAQREPVTIDVVRLLGVNTNPGCY